MSPLKDNCVSFSPEGEVGAASNDQTASGGLARPDYLGPQFGNDIAPISLAMPVTSVTLVKVVGTDDPDPVFGAPGVIVGYGPYGTGPDAQFCSNEGTPEALDNPRRCFGEAPT